MAASASSPVVAEDVSYVGRDGVRRFFDGAAVGLLRSLRAHKVVGNLAVGGKVDPELFHVAPDPDGAFIPLSLTAARLCEAKSRAGFYVVAPLSLAYDTRDTRYLWVSKDSAPAQGNADFAVLAHPTEFRRLLTLSMNPESGG